MHHFLLIYFNSKPLHVSSRLAAHHQEDQLCINSNWYRGADKSLARPTSQCILFDGENISFDASLVIYIYSSNYDYK